LIEVEECPAWLTLCAFSAISCRTFATRSENVSFVVSVNSGLATAVFVVAAQAISCIAAASIEVVFRMIYSVSTMTKKAGNFHGSGPSCFKSAALGWLMFSMNSE